VAALLLGEALAQLLHDLFPAAELFDFPLLLFGEVELADGAQPFLRDMRLDGVAHQLEALEDVAEHLVEAVQVALVLHQRGAGEIVEVLHAAVGEVGLEGFHQRQILLQRHRQAGGSELMEEVDEHRGTRLVARRSA